jgi:hypothetical protein
MSPSLIGSQRRPRPIKPNCCGWCCGTRSTTNRPPISTTPSSPEPGWEAPAALDSNATPSSCAQTIAPCSPEPGPSGALSTPKPASPSASAPKSAPLSRWSCRPRYNEILEARIGVEPTNKGFADLCLTTWLPRPACNVAIPLIPCPPLECQPALRRPLVTLSHAPLRRES